MNSKTLQGALVRSLENLFTLAEGDEPRLLVLQYKLELPGQNHRALGPP
jgi:hypothetical protein